MDKYEDILKVLLETLEEGIHIVDSDGNTIYYNSSMSKVEGLRQEQVIGKKVTEYLKGVEDDASTLMNALKNNRKYVDIIQQYKSNSGNKITTINTTIPVVSEGKVIAAIEISKDLTRLKELNEKICKLQPHINNNTVYYSFKDIIGNSNEQRRAVNIAMKASLSNSSVLIYGETGCGKELLSQSIYSNGIRKDKPFIAINCAAIPDALLESMLFGTVKGSFTGAENKKGLFEEARKGTIMLDEVNSMNPTLQSKLLRVLQDGYLRPLGSNKMIDVDVRIIATLNEEPEKLIKEGKLRKDFYYRLSVIRIDVPPLRERKEDIPLFIDEFLKYYNKILGKNVQSIEPCVMDSFFDYDWPGNVRELKNTIESAMNMCDNEKILFKQYFDNRIVNNIVTSCNVKSNIEGEQSLEEYIDKIERDVIYNSLIENSFNITKTSKKLKISRQNLQYKIKKYKLVQ